MIFHKSGFYKEEKKNIYIQYQTDDSRMPVD